MIQTIEVVVKDQLNDQGNGTFTVTYPRTATTVLSIQPDGSAQTRPEGTTGPWEVCVMTSKGLLFKPTGTCFLVPYAE